MIWRWYKTISIRDGVSVTAMQWRETVPHDGEVPESLGDDVVFHVYDMEIDLPGTADDAIDP